ncbi:MAG: 23S rRNA (adenine(2503)-C(2))-methyltransferase RlmN [Candidatus Omnitrophica bacterium]|nr:23S rRNA (adenine(2503)-C(2))-methyltransferase RlmN [Candidatus Omnitrophota bacterium]
MATVDIKDLNLIELERELALLSAPRFRAKQIFSWIFQKGVFDFDLMTNLPAEMREKLKEKFHIIGFKLVKKSISIDQTQKLLLGLWDGNLIESVIIPATDRVTGCVSAQAGCKYACGFCASGASGFKRNLTCGEILEQVLLIKCNAEANKLTHIVFMGTGEPLDNYENVLKAIRIINSKEALNIGQRRITISTCGLIPEIKKLAKEGLQIELSVSLHAADELTRSKIMPINKKYPLKDLIPVLRAYIEETNRQVTFEYTMIKGLNSDLESARNLAKIMAGMECKVNLIPCNPIKELGLEPPGKVDILMFKDVLIKADLNVTMRASRGQDIEAACGQLRLRYENK